MMDTATYEVNIYINGVLVGDCRSLAEGLTYTRRRTKMGADSIDFTINDVLFNRWCNERHFSLKDLLKPLALECRLVRDGIEVVGGFLATMPAYTPLQTSADLSLHFDGFLNLLAGVYIRNTTTGLPLGTVSGTAGELVSSMISFANDVSDDAGKSYGLTAGDVDAMPSISQTFDNFKTVKDWICDRCDNATGAGPFDVYFHADKTYDIKSEANFGDVITSWVANYPTILNAPSATSVQAQEVGAFTSAIIGIGSGEISSNSDENTAILQFTSNPSAISEFGYYETTYQESSISDSSVLLRNMNSRLSLNSNPTWQPQITLHGKQIAPKPTGTYKIWLGDIITVNNTADLTGMTNGKFRVNELSVVINSAGDETITPVLERVNE